MGDMGDDFRAYKEYKKEMREKYGKRCESCALRLPKAQPKILMPGQRCWCGWKDPRERLVNNG